MIHENLVEIDCLYSDIIADLVEIVNTNKTRRSRTDLEQKNTKISKSFMWVSRKNRSCDLTTRTPHDTLAKPASDTKVSKCFCGYFCAYNHTITYTKILKDSILIKHEDIFIKVFKTLF